MHSPERIREEVRSVQVVRTKGVCVWSERGLDLRVVLTTHIRKVLLTERTGRAPRRTGRSLCKVQPLSWSITFSNSQLPTLNLRSLTPSLQNAVWRTYSSLFGGSNVAFGIWDLREISIIQQEVTGRLGAGEETRMDLSCKITMLTGVVERDCSAPGDGSPVKGRTFLSSLHLVWGVQGAGNRTQGWIPGRGPLSFPRSIIDMQWFCEQGLYFIIPSFF